MIIYLSENSEESKDVKIRHQLDLITLYQYITLRLSLYDYCLVSQLHLSFESFKKNKYKTKIILLRKG